MSDDAERPLPHVTDATAAVPEHRAAVSDRRDMGRWEAFSDGVFSVVITLLAYDLKPDTMTHAETARQLVAALVAPWPLYLAFFTSFATVLIMWMNHHGIFRFAHRVDLRLIFANGFLLMVTTLVPFTTTLVADHFLKASARAAGAVYAGLFVLINVGYNVTWWVIRQQRSAALARAPRDLIRRITRNYAVGLPLYLVAALAALWSPGVSIAICTALWVHWAFNTRPVHATPE